jgi:hypothetical protein
LVPGTTGAVAIYGLISKEFKDIWSYEEEHGREKSEKSEENEET